MNKKVLIVVIAAFILIGGISFFLIRYFENSPKSFESLLGTNESNITNVLLADRDHDVVVTDNKEKIKELINLLNGRNYTKSSIQDDRAGTGYSYYYEFYPDPLDGVRVRISDDGTKVRVDKVNAVFYDVSKPISLSSLANWNDSILIQKSSN